MTTPPLEDHLTRLADGLVAPATPEARQAIGHRTRVLRRRRRAVRAAGSGVVALAVIGGIALTRPDPNPEAEVANPSRLPTFTLEVPGFEIVTARDGVTVDLPIGSEQVFVTPGDPEGPRLVLRHVPSSDAFAPATSDEDVVAVGEAEGRLTHPEPDELVLRWSPPLGDNTAEIEARGLTQDQVVGFAEGLQAKDQDGFQYPPMLDDTFGFVPTSVPDGLEEVTADDAPDGSGPGHLLVADGDSATAELTVMPADDPDRQATLDALAATAGEREALSVLGRPAQLVAGPSGLTSWLVWQPQDGVSAVLEVTGGDRSTIDALIDGLREVSEDEWEALVAAHSTP